MKFADKEELSEVLYMDFNEVVNRIKNNDTEFVFEWNDICKPVFEKLTEIIFN